MTESTNTTRLVACAILFLGTLVMGTLPVYLLQLVTRFMQKRRDQSGEHSEHNSEKAAWWRRVITHDRVVAFLTQFGGGVLLYTSLIHMLPEIRENYEKYLESNDSTVITADGYEGTDEVDSPDDVWHSLPMVDIFTCVGFFGIFLVEEVMHSICLGGHSHHHGPSEQVVTPVRRTPKRLSLRNYLHGQRNYSHHVDEVDIPNTPPNSLTNGTNGTKKSANSLVILPETHPISSHSPSSYHTCDQGKHCQGHHEADLESQSEISIDLIDKEPSIWARMLDNFLLILAFSCHSIFDGISIGVQPNESEIWTMLIAILSHKLIIAFILSFQIHEKCTRAVPDPRNPLAVIQKPIKGAKMVLWFFSTLFALMSPLGIIMIVAINGNAQTPDESSLRIIILAALSAGTIIYIVFMEIIDKSSSRVHIPGIVQWVALVVGFAVMHFISQQFHE